MVVPVAGSFTATIRVGRVGGVPFLCESVASCSDRAPSRCRNRTRTPPARFSSKDDSLRVARSHENRAPPAGQRPCCRCDANSATTERRARADCRCEVEQRGAPGLRLRRVVAQRWNSGAPRPADIVERERVEATVRGEPGDAVRWEPRAGPLWPAWVRNGSPDETLVARPTRATERGRDRSRARAAWKPEGRRS